MVESEHGRRWAFGRALSPLSMFSTAFIAAANHLLARSRWARERLAPHAERRARLRVDAVAIDFSITSTGALCEVEGEGIPDVELLLPAAEIPRLMLGQLDQAMRQVRIEGNAEFADALGFVFRNLRWDVEEDLSQVVGDIAAHRLVSTANGVREANARAWRSFGENLTEYLTEESALLVGRVEAAAHEQALRALRDDLARLDKRIDRLAARSSRPTSSSA